MNWVIIFLFIAMAVATSEQKNRLRNNGSYEILVDSSVVQFYRLAPHISLSVSLLAA
ncbi:MAG: hypothetical protein JKX67_11230 [Colwellia sp.]|nr:hypothetical protein [Colwellia sp.]